MERVTHGYGYSLRFHISAGVVSPVDIGFNSKTARQLLAARVAKFTGNDHQARSLQSGGEPEVVICGEGGTLNALAMAGAITSPTVLAIFKAESALIAAAQRDYNGGMFSALISEAAERQARIELIEGEFKLDAGQSFYIRRGENREEVYVGVHAEDLDFSRYIMVLREIVPGVRWSAVKSPVAPLGTPLIKPYLKDFESMVEGLTIVEPKMIIIGGRGNNISLEEIRQEIVRQTFLPYDKQQVDDALKRLGIPPPVEIGLEPKNKYKLIGGILGGVAVVGAGGLLARRAYKKNKSRS